MRDMSTTPVTPTEGERKISALLPDVVACLERHGVPISGAIATELYGILNGHIATVDAKAQLDLDVAHLFACRLILCAELVGHIIRGHGSQRSDIDLIRRHEVILFGFDIEDPVGARASDVIAAHVPPDTQTSLVSVDQAVAIALGRGVAHA